MATVLEGNVSFQRARVLSIWLSALSSALAAGLIYSGMGKQWPVHGLTGATLLLPIALAATVSVSFLDTWFQKVPAGRLVLVVALAWVLALAVEIATHVFRGPYPAIVVAATFGPAAHVMILAFLRLSSRPEQTDNGSSG